MTFQTVFKNEKEFEEFKTWTFGVLHDENITDLRITFTKKDGTERAMQCTLCPKRIPEISGISENKKPTSETSTAGSQTSGSAVRIFDTEKQEWRSFRWDSVIKVEFSL
jgi:hypothetical protein